MKIAGMYSNNNALEYLEDNYPNVINEIEKVLSSIDAEEHKTKISKEKTNKGTLLYSPVDLNNSFKDHFKEIDWNPLKINCDYSNAPFENGFKSANEFKNASREIDFVKDKVGIEIQFGKYAFMLYDVLGKMSVFKNKGLINCGIEIVPTRSMTKEMSTGVGYYEQVVYDLKEMSEEDIPSTPILVIGIE